MIKRKIMLFWFWGELSLFILNSEALSWTCSTLDPQQLVLLLKQSGFSSANTSRRSEMPRRVSVARRCGVCIDRLAPSVRRLVHYLCARRTQTKEKYNAQHKMYLVKGAENTLFYSTDLEWFHCILKAQNKMTPDVLKNVFYESFWSWCRLCPWGETLMSSTEQWNVSCFSIFCHKFLFKKKKKKKKCHWLASESLSSFMCETPLHLCKEPWSHKCP